MADSMQSRLTVHIYGCELTKGHDKIANQLSGEIADMNTLGHYSIVQT